MVWITRFKIYTTASALVHTFQAVQDTNHPRDPRKYIEIKGQRGIGSIIIDGGKDSWDLWIKGALYTTGYQNLTAAMDAMVAAVDQNVAYYLKIDKTPSTAYSYNVKRIKDIDWGKTFYRNDFIHYTITLRANSW